MGDDNVLLSKGADDRRDQFDTAPMTSNWTTNSTIKPTNANTTASNSGWT
jgi:hypothetical protein